ncbi:MAG: hypothetical protein ACE5JX_22755 [Acidobacteriota bacterium]
MLRTATLSTLVLVTFVHAETFWTGKPFTEWTEKEARSLLNHSPWVRQATFSVFAAPRVAGDRSRREIRYFVSFRSAKPIRMALARMAMLTGQFDQDRAEDYVQTRPFDGEIVVALASDSRQRRGDLDSHTTDHLKSSTYLQVGKKGRRLQLRRYLGPSESKTNEGLFLFQREEIVPEDKEISFVTDLGAGIKLKSKFKLRPMVFEGSVEL